MFDPKGVQADCNQCLHLPLHTYQVNGQKLEEIKAKDGHTYVTMPLL